MELAEWTLNHDVSLPLIFASAGSSKHDPVGNHGDDPSWHNAIRWLAHSILLEVWCGPRWEQLARSRPQLVLRELWILFNAHAYQPWLDFCPYLIFPWSPDNASALQRSYNPFSKVVSKRTKNLGFQRSETGWGRNSTGALFFASLSNSSMQSCSLLSSTFTM